MIDWIGPKVKRSPWSLGHQTANDLAIWPGRSQENRDRSALYAEIARANGHPEWEPDIRQIFARRWIDNAPRGWWYMDAGGNWTQK